METNLFGETLGPEGFAYSEEFISPQEEQALIQEVQALELEPYQYQGFEAKRLVHNFGDGGERFPAWLLSLAQRAERHFKLPDPLSSAHIIYYPVGTPIGWHRDSPPHDIVVGVSLGSPARFRLRRELPHKKWERFERIAEPRSIYMMSGPARYVWQHSIPPVEQERYSITMRTKR